MTSSRITTSLSLVAASLLAASLGRAQTQTLYIPQVADGGSWQTTLVITNTSSTSAPINSINFYQETSPGVGQPNWNLSFKEAVPTSVPAGSTVLLHSLGTAASTATGWGAMTAGPGIQAYAIFTQRIAGRQDQDGTGLALPAASRFLVPFDQTLGSVVGLAIANVTNSQQTVTLAVRTLNGSVTQASIPVGPYAHFNFPLNSLNLAPSQVSPVINAASGQSGLLEVFTSSPSLAVLTLRFNVTASFTAAPVYAEAGPPVIGTVTGATPAAFSQLFINGTWVTNTQSQVVINITPNSDGVTYKAAVVSAQQPYVLASFSSGTLQGQTLTFNIASSTGNGIFGTTSITGGSLTLNVTSFDTVGSAVTGNLTINSTTGSLSGTSTYQP